LTSSGNEAVGGAGGSGVIGGDGGDGQGGGLFVDVAATVALTGGSITNNQAIGGAYGWGTTTNGTDGEGQGGGVFLTVAGSTRSGTIISGNSASTSGNNIFGTFS